MQSPIRPPATPRKMIQKVLFNVVCDKKNLNNRIYPRPVVDQIVEKLNTGRVFVQHADHSTWEDTACVCFERVVGMIEHADLTDEGTIRVEFSTIQTARGKDMSTLIEKLGTDCFELTLCGIGTVSVNTVRDYKLIYVAVIAPQEPFVEEEKETSCVGTLYSRKPSPDDEEVFC